MSAGAQAARRATSKWSEHRSLTLVDLGGDVLVQVDRNLISTGEAHSSRCQSLATISDAGMRSCAVRRGGGAAAAPCVGEGQGVDSPFVLGEP